MSNPITVPFIGVPGPPGGPPSTTLTAGFIQPAVGASVTIAVATSVAIPFPSNCNIDVGGAYLITARPDGQHINVTNLGISSLGANNAAPGVAVPIGGNVVVVGPTQPLGLSVVGNASAFDLFVPWQVVPANTTSAIYTLPGTLVLTDETVEMWARVFFRSASGTDCAQWTRDITVTNTTALGITTPSGVTTDTDLTSPIFPGNTGTSLQTATAKIQIVGGTLVINATAPAGTAMNASAMVSWVRSPLTAPGLLPTIASLSVTSGGSSGGTSTVITGTNFVNVSTILFGTFQVASGSYTVNSTTQITVNSTPAGSGTNLTLSVTTNGGTGTLPSAWTYNNELDLIWKISGVPCLVAWWRDDGMQNSGPSLVSVTDRTGNGFTQTVGAGTVTFNSADANFNGRNSFTTDGATSYMTSPNIPLTLGGASGGDASMIILACARTLAAPGVGGLVTYQTATTPIVELLELSGNVDGEGHGRGSATGGSAITNLSRALMAFSSSVGAGTQNVSAVSNGTQFTATGTGGAPGAGRAATIGCRAGPASFLNAKFADVAVIMLAPGTTTANVSTQLAQSESYFQARYGVP
jgi:large repetitive protein